MRIRQRPIYVEIEIQAPMDKLWQHTQQPELHEQWDMRFSEIRYLPQEEDGLQRFTYRTRIGFGLQIAGTGVTRASYNEQSGAKVSTLAFGSQQRLSLINSGHGYWKYIPHEAGITFLTRYQYQTRFGRLGRWFDAFLFRPMFGYATAWSFDVLRLWLEKQIPPACSIRQAIIHYTSVALLCVLWLFEGASLSIIAFCFLAAVTSKNLPQASRCKRQPGQRSEAA
ncbi:SRPBCC family protein [Paenibacillus sp. GCM10027626]|uniref:SRPBCC family protein n=1 Tax=Paenibacillus sp. GCM10027626 TaxID=3273411 RepID=UPI003625BFA4